MVSETSEAWTPGKLAAGVALCLLVSVTAAWAQQGALEPSPVAPSKGEIPAAGAPDAPGASVTDYTVSPEDLLDVQVMDVPEVSRAYRVSSNGYLTMPLLPKPIPVTGETLDQLARLIAAKFRDAGMLNNAQVTVSLRETTRHTVLVSGEVRNPQAYPVYGPTHLIDVLVKAGGLTSGAGGEAIITRGEVGARAGLPPSAGSEEEDFSANRQPFTLNIRKLVESGDDETNILLYPGDRVTVQRAELIYVMGAVVRPGGYVLNDARQHTTVLKALAMAGDVNNIAKKGKITILRRDPAIPGEQREEIPVDYKAMVKGRSPDIKLIADDILFVPESGGLKALHASTTAAVQMVSSGGSALMIYH